MPNAKTGKGENEISDQLIALAKFNAKTLLVASAKLKVERLEDCLEEAKKELADIIQSKYTFKEGSDWTRFLKIN